LKIRPVATGRVTRQIAVPVSAGLLPNTDAYFQAGGSYRDGALGSILFAQVGRRDDCSRHVKGRQRSEISDADRDCFVPSQFDFLSTKWRKARRRMQCNVISPHGTVLSPAIGYN
jgi:hypothetical protein